MKNKKGISLIALVVMMIIMIILANIAINVSMNAYDESQRAKQAAERQQVVDAVTGRFGDYQRNGTANPIIGLIIPEDQSETKEDTFNYIIEKLKGIGKLVTEEEVQNKTQTKQIKKFVEDNSEDMEYTRILQYNDLLELGLENTNLYAVYLVNYYSSDVVGPIT